MGRRPQSRSNNPVSNLGWRSECITYHPNFTFWDALAIVAALAAALIVIDPIDLIIHIRLLGFLFALVHHPHLGLYFCL